MKGRQVRGGGGLEEEEEEKGGGREEGEGGERARARPRENSTHNFVCVFDSL